MTYSERIQAPGGSCYQVASVISERLSSARSAKGQLQRMALAVLLEHRDDDALPTNGRFLFYELEQRGVVEKSKPGEGRRKPGARGSQDLTDALMWLREQAIIPWSWIEDETRSIAEWRYADTIADYLVNSLEIARITLWPGKPPLILVESRSLGGVLRETAAEYLCPITATNGQVGGFLRTDVAPKLKGNDRAVLYLGDHDHQGDQIEANTRRVLEHEAGRPIAWTRLAITREQIDERGLEPVWKKDHRYKPPREHEAWETEALGQTAVIRLVRDRLDALVPEPLDRVHERERQQRGEWLAVLDGVGSDGS